MAGKPTPPIAAPFAGLFGDTAIEPLSEVTPPASLATLIFLNMFVHRAMTQPYAVTALTCNTGLALSGTMAVNNPGPVNVAGTDTAFTTELSVGDFVTIGGETRVVNAITNDVAMSVTIAFSGTSSGQPGEAGRWYWAQRVNSGCAWMRGRFHFATTPGEGGTPNEGHLYSSSSGISAADRIPVELAPDGTVSYPPGPWATEFRSGEEFNASPAEPTDRPYEMNVRATDQDARGTATAPYTEGFSGSGPHGFSAIWVGVADMSIL